MSVSPKEKGHTRRPLPPPRPQTHTPRHSSTSLKEASVTSSSPRPHAHLHAHALWHVRRGPSAYLLSVEARSGSEGREGLGRNGANVWGFLERHARGEGGVVALIGLCSVVITVVVVVVIISAVTVAIVIIICVIIIIGCIVDVIVTVNCLSERRHNHSYNRYCRCRHCQLRRHCH